MHLSFSPLSPTHPWSPSSTLLCSRLAFQMCFLSRCVEQGSLPALQLTQRAEAWCVPNLKQSYNGLQKYTIQICTKLTQLLGVNCYRVYLNFVHVNMKTIQISKLNLNKLIKKKLPCLW